MNYVEGGSTGFIDEERIADVLARSPADDAGAVAAALARARSLGGLDLAEVAVLARTREPALVEQILHAAREVKEAIYGSRLVLFAPLYISNLCGNDCSYCAFRARNRALRRRALDQDEIRNEVAQLVDQGHKRVLLVAGEAYPPEEGFRYVLRAVESIYSVKRGNGEIRRVNANVAPLAEAQFRELKATGIGTYQLFQETYHRATYAEVHLGGRKRDYDWRVSVMDRAMAAGIDDVGIGVLFGLADWRFELLALMQHLRHLEAGFGVGPHTISVPRIEPAIGCDVAAAPPHAVSDDDFRKLVAILRLAVPYTGIIMSTRENAAMRRDCFALGVSQISAGSRTDPGGYAQHLGDEFAGSQFQLGDHRSLDEVVRDVASLGYLPSFCTACYRLGRTGRDFMDLAKPGEIKDHCSPNALSTFVEYLLDYASPETRAVGEALVQRTLATLDEPRQRLATNLLTRVRDGRRDVFV